MTTTAAESKQHQRSAAPEGVEVLGPMAEGYEKILTPDALAFVAELERRFGARRRELLERRAEMDARIQGGWTPNFLPETAEVRRGDWTVAPIPADLRDRRVEITGPTDRKMVVNALNSGASVYMPDFEDANTPTWDNQVRGQINLYDAIRRQVDFTEPGSG
jgi:malate synthase